MKNYKLKLKIIRFFFVLLILNFSFLTFHLSEANAQQVSLSLSPPLLELFIKPGKSIMAAYKLENFGDPTFFNLKILPFEAKDSFGNIKIKTEFGGPVRFSLDNSDLKLEQPFFLKTNGSQQISLLIRIPENIADGDHVASISKSLTGVYAIDFNFKVDDRYILITPHNAAEGVVPTARFSASDEIVTVTMVDTDATDDEVDCDFDIVVF